ATLTWLLWLMAPGDLLTRASYLSETTSAALWLVGWWALLRWRDTGRSGHLFTLAASAGWAFLTRPLTAVALAVPVGIVVLREVGRRRAWRPLAMAALVGGLLAAIVPLWSWQTMGDWRTTPYRQYSRVYYPYQWSGFRFNDSPPLRPYPPEMKEFDRQFRRVQREHRVGALPGILGERLAAIGGDVWAGRRALMAFALLGALGAPPEALFALASSLVLVLAYLIYAHAAAWSVYYLETHATLAYLTALGLWRVLSGLAARLSPVPGRAKAFLRWGFRALVLAAVVPAALQVALSRWAADERGAEQARFRNALDGIAGREAIVFVRHAATHDPHRELVANEPDLKASRAWIVRDRGGENRKLMRLAPGRAPYLYDESRHLLSPLAAGG
ncbi:MAG TPA: hypothetical protein VK780_08985, partial [Thermoanaerobaculia bacterium]|nr:hypothetical protein [Thermoanaerobaculia bacterium]